MIVCLGFSITRRAARAIWKSGNKEGETIFGNGKCELIANFSATMVTSPRGRWKKYCTNSHKKVCGCWCNFFHRPLPLREGRDGKCEGRNEKCEFLARESVNSSPIVRILAKGSVNSSPMLARKWWRHFRLSLSLCISLSLSPNVPHAQYYRKRGSASYYRKRGSASYIVREWLLWVVERERETPVTSSISRWNREWSCTWLPRQRVDPMHMHTRRRVLSLHLLSSARSAWQAKTTNSNSCDRAVAQVKYRSTYPNNPGEWTTSTEEISKKGIKLILKTVGNRKGDCAWSCSRGQTQPEKICKLQSTNQ